MLEKIPGHDDLSALVGEAKACLFEKLSAAIDEKYDMEREWNSGGKKWAYEYKFRRGGKTLCALYAKENCIGLMIIFGKDEREKVEAIRNSLSAEVQKAYDEAETFRDGKWVMFLPEDLSRLDDYCSLLEVKRKPNRK